MSNPIITQPLRSDQVDQENPDELPDARRIKRKNCCEKYCCSLRSICQCFSECCDAIEDCLGACSDLICCDCDDNVSPTSHNRYYINNDDNNTWNTNDDTGFPYDNPTGNDNSWSSGIIDSGHHHGGHHDSGGHCDFGGGYDGGGGDSGGGDCGGGGDDCGGGDCGGGGGDN